MLHQLYLFRTYEIRSQGVYVQHQVYEKQTEIAFLFLVLRWFTGWLAPTIAVAALLFQILILALQETVENVDALVQTPLDETALHYFRT